MSPGELSTWRVIHLDNKTIAYTQYHDLKVTSISFLLPEFLVLRISVHVFSFVQ